jgi:hypothetical protein
MSVSSPNTWLTHAEFCTQRDDEHGDDANNDHTDCDAIDNEGEDDYL